jgi:hypothetical protein
MPPHARAAAAARGHRFAAWSWCKLPVDPAEAHLELRFGSLQEPDSSTPPILIARVGRPVNRVSPVEWLVRPADGQRQALEAVTKDLDYYLVAKGEADPWLYAQYLVDQADTRSGLTRSASQGM